MTALSFLKTTNIPKLHSKYHFFRHDCTFYSFPQNYGILMDEKEPAWTHSQISFFPHACTFYSSHLTTWSLKPINDYPIGLKKLEGESAKCHKSKSPNKSIFGGRYVAWSNSSWAEICVKFCDIITERESDTAKMTPRFDPHMLRLLRQLPTCFSEIQNTTSFSNHKKIIKNTSRSSEMPNTTISLINKKPSRIPCHSKK